MSQPAIPVPDIEADRYAVLGHPVNHSLSPMIHAAFARQTGATLAYSAVDVEPADFAQVVADFFAGGGRGLNVTVPHKSRAFALCDRVTMRARVAGAVNTLWRASDGLMHGDITDGEGLVLDLCDRLGHPVRDQRVLILGAGGSVFGCLGALLARQPALVCIANRTAHKALTAASNFAGLGTVRGCGLRAVDGPAYDVVINATAASLAGESVNIAPAAVAGAACYDLMYAKGGTVFTRWAQAHGARSVHTGIGMLVDQAALAFELWRGVRPDSNAVRELLAKEHGYTF